MSEQLQSRTQEDTNARFNDGDYIALHEGDLRLSYEQGRALSDATQAAESYTALTPEHSHVSKHEQIKKITECAFWLRREELAQSELELAA
jgi:hypothetical protein